MGDKTTKKPTLGRDSGAIRTALVVLAGATTVSACSDAGIDTASDARIDTASLERENSPVVSMVEVNQPENIQVQTPSWTRVSIQLTQEQQTQLANLGVSTDELSITTYDISQLAGNVVN